MRKPTSDMISRGVALRPKMNACDRTDGNVVAPTRGECNESPTLSSAAAAAMAAVVPLLALGWTMAAVLLWRARTVARRMDDDAPRVWMGGGSPMVS